MSFKHFRRELESINRDPDSYFMFGKEEERKEVYKYSKAVAEYLHDEKIPSLVLIDRSARPAYVGILEYWHNAYPNQRFPNTYFINPAAFRSIDTQLRSDSLDRLMAYGEPTQNNMDDEGTVRTFQESYKQLNKDRDKPVLIFDCCIHSGETIAPVLEIFKKAGFKDPKIGSVTPADTESSVDSDYYVTTETPSKICYPFQQDRMVLKNTSAMTPEAQKDHKLAEGSRRIREEIKQTIQDEIKNDPEFAE